MSVGVLLVVTDANAKARFMQDVMTNLSFTMDSMTREIRTGSGFFCADNNLSANLSPDFEQDCEHGTYLSIVEDVGQSIVAGGSPRIFYRYNQVEQRAERRVGVDDE